MAAAPATGKTARVRAALTREEWRRAGGLALVITALHVVGFGLLFGVVVPGHLALGGGGTFGVGLGITAYTLGMRHAFDVDHIAAIDNTTRKLMADGDRPLSVGFFFSLGHSSVVFVLAAVLSLGIRGLSGQVSRQDSGLHQITGFIGPAVSGVFLLLVGVMNLVVFLGILKLLRRSRDATLDDVAVEEQLARRGLMNRFLGRATRAVSKPWHMYPLGLLFGLGFDTATEVALLATAGAAAADGLPFYAILCLPVLFAAGMSLLDTIDGAFMALAYGWAFAEPVRKLHYNLTVTGLSVIIALVIGSAELMTVLADQLQLTGQPWAFASGLDLNAVGYVIVGMFAMLWLVAFAIWRMRSTDGHGRLRGARNVLVADASILPSCPGVNPQLSIMALAAQVAADAGA